MISRGATSRKIRIIVPSVGVLIAGVILFALPSIGAPGMAVLVVSVGYGFAAMVFLLLNAAVSEICPPRQTAGTLGAFLAIMAIGGLVAPYATGVIVDAASTPAQGYATAFQILGALAAACPIDALVCADPDRDKRLLRGTAETAV